MDYGIIRDESFKEGCDNVQTEDGNRRGGVRGRSGARGRERLRRGLPLVFNGNEIADNSLNTFFAAVEDVGRARKTVDWVRALQPAGRKRLALIRKLAALRHGDALFQDAPMEWVTDGEAKGATAFTRQAGGRRATATDI